MRRAVVASVAGLGVVGSSVMGSLAGPVPPLASPAAGVLTALLPPVPEQPRILFAGAPSAGSADSALDVWDVVASDGSQLRHLVDTTTATGDLLGDTAPSYSPDGTRVVLASAVDPDEGGGRRLVVADLADLDPGTSPMAQAEPLPAEWAPGTWDGEPDWSPDGGDVVFTRQVLDGSGEPDGTRLRVVDVETGVVTDPFADVGIDYEDVQGADSALSPAWSPDGSQILFTTVRSGDGLELWILDLEAGELRSVTEQTDDGLLRLEGTGPSWSPDGTRIAFAATDGLVTAVLGEVLSTPEDVRILAEPETLYETAPDEVGLVSLDDPVWAPDGTEITVQAWEQPPEQEGLYLGLYAVAVDDGTYRTVLGAPDGTFWGELVGHDHQPWSDLEVSLEADRSTGIGLGELVGLTATVTNPGPSTAWGATLELELPGAAEGMDVAVGWPAECDGDGGTRTCALDGPLEAGDSAELTITVALDEPGSYAAGARVTASTVDPLTEDNVAAVVLDAPFPAAVGTEPRLAFTFAHGRSEDRRLDVADVLAADASDFRILVDEEVVEGDGSARPEESEPSYSSDGRRLVFSSQPHEIEQEGGQWEVPGDPTLFVADVGTGGATGVEQLLVEEGPIATRPAWSPDGTRVAYLRNWDSSPNLAVLDLATGAVQEWQVAATDIAWSPDSAHVVLTSPDGDSEGTLLVVDVDDGAIFPLLAEVTACTGAPDDCVAPVVGQDPAWSPDGGRIAFTSGDGVHTVAVTGPTTTPWGEEAYLVPEPLLVAEPAGAGYPEPSQPTWSPDSGALTFVGSAAEGPGVLLTVASGGGPVTVLRADFPGIAPSVADPVYQPWADVSVALLTPRPVDAGQPAAVTAVVTNHGPSPAWETEVAVDLPAVAAGDATLETWPAQCTPAATGLQCALPGSLPVDQPVELTLVLRTMGAGGLAVGARVATASVDPEPGNDVAATTLVVREPPPPVLEPHLAFTRWASQPGSAVVDRDVADVPARGAPFARLLAHRVTTVDGQEVRLEERHPAYSPDGTRLALSAAPADSVVTYPDLRLAMGDLVPGAVPAAESALTGLRLLDYETEPGWSDIEPVWSPDGTEIAFTRRDSFYGIERRVHVLDVATGVVQEVVLPEDAGFAAQAPSWSPDGDRLGVQVTGPSEREELWVAHLGDGAWYPVGVPGDGCTGTPRECLEPVWGVAPAWSPDGTRIAAGDGYLDDDAPERSAVLVHDVPDAPADGVYAVSGSRVLAGLPADAPGELPPGAMDVAWHPAWSPDGAEIAFVGRLVGEGWSSLYAAPAAGGAAQVRVAEWSATLPGGYADPGYQPWSDVALVLRPPVGDVVAGEPTVLGAVVTGAGPSPAWGLVVTLELPPGQHIIDVPAGCTVSGPVVTCARPGPLAPGQDVTIEVTALFDDAGAHEVTGGVTATTLDPVPDNDTDAVVVDVAARVPGTGVEPRLAFSHVPDLDRELPSDLADVFWSDGEEFRVLADERVTDPAGQPHLAGEAHPSYSPDGRQLVFSADRDVVAFTDPETWYSLEGRHRLMVGRTQPGATGLADVAPLDYERPTGVSDTQPAWSPDGTRIAFVRDTGEETRLALVDLASGDVRLVELDVSVGEPTWSPDGERLVVEGDDRLWVVSLAGDELHAVVVVPESCAGPDGSCDQPLTGRDPAWSPDGTHLALVALDPTLDRDALLSVTLPGAPDADGTYRVPPPVLLAGPADDASWYPADPDWSLDGTSVAFAAHGAGTNGTDAILTVPAGGGEATVLREEVTPGLRHGFADLDHQPWADVGVGVDHSAAQVPAGGPVDVTVTATNHGPSPAWDVRVELALPGGTAHLAAVPEGCAVAGDILECAGPQVMPVGSAQTFTARLVLDHPGTHETVATVTSRMVDPVPQNDVARAAVDVVAPPPLAVLSDVAVRLELSAPTGWVGGDPVTATAVVTNEAEGEATDVLVTMSYPAAVEVGSTACLAAAPCSLGTLGPGASGTVVVELLPTEAGTGPVSATVATSAVDVNPANDSATATVDVRQPELRLLPSVATPGEATLAYGSDFPPGARLTLSWDRGLTAWVRPVAVLEDGTVRVPLLVLPGDELGQRLATATAAEGPGFGDVVAPPMLVVPPTSTPPDFLRRG